MKFNGHQRKVIMIFNKNTIYIYNNRNKAKLNKKFIKKNK